MLSKIAVYKSNLMEGNIKVKMFENSRLHYLPVDSSKFNIEIITPLKMVAPELIR
ncbi:MAG TPA: hypothetical protein VFD10_07410 [Atribacterota bacterium]|nr:hypothetical protein [Atribacterota bacterium]